MVWYVESCSYLYFVSPKLQPLIGVHMQLKYIQQHKVYKSKLWIDSLEAKPNVLLYGPVVAIKLFKFVENSFFSKNEKSQAFFRRKTNEKRKKCILSNGQ